MEENKNETLETKVEEAPKEETAPKQKGSPLKAFLLFIFILIVGFVLATYVYENKSNPVPTAEPIVNTDPAEELQATTPTLSIDFDKIDKLYDPEKVVLKVGNTDVKWKNYSFFYKNTVSQYMYYLPADVDFNTVDPQIGMSYNEFFATAAEDTLGYYISMIQMPVENGITEEDVKEDLQATEKTYLEQYKVTTMDELYKTLEEQYGVSKEAFDLITKASIYSNKLFTKMYGENFEKIDDNEAIDLIKASNYIYVQHILFSKYDMATNSQLDEQSYKTKAAKAEELYKELSAIADNEERAKKFEEYAAQYNDDGNSKYCFTEGTMVIEFETAAKELKEYEIKLVETTYGTHLIMKLPIDPNAVLLDHNMTGKEVIANQKFLQEMADYRTKMEVKRADDFVIPDLNEFKVVK